MWQAIQSAGDPPAAIAVAFTRSAEPEQIIADIINPETRGNLYPHYHALRDAAPIHKTHNPILHEAWVFTRHADSDQLLGRPRGVPRARPAQPQPRRQPAQWLRPGAYYCLGSSLARAEAIAALDALVQRFPTLELNPDKPAPVYRPTLVLHGHEHLHVRWN